MEYRVHPTNLYQNYQVMWSELSEILFHSKFTKNNQRHCEKYVSQNYLDLRRATECLNFFSFFPGCCAHIINVVLFSHFFRVDWNKMISEIILASNRTSSIISRRRSDPGKFPLFFTRCEQFPESILSPFLSRGNGWFWDEIHHSFTLANMQCTYTYSGDDTALVKSCHSIIHNMPRTHSAAVTAPVNPCIIIPI